MNDYVLLLIGIACAGTGGELFVRGLVSLGRWARISPAIVGATFAAFATSSPELAVGISSALEGTPQVSFGDVLGSNVANVGLITGVTLAIGSLRASRADLKRDFPVAIAVPFIIGVLSIDGRLSRADGMLLIVFFIAWLTSVIFAARRQRQGDAGEFEGNGKGRSILFCVLGLVILVVAGRLIVSSAIGIAASWGIGTFVVGALLVAVSTSVPELATSVIAKIRGHDEISLGTILGSNIFNCLGIIGVVSMLCPFQIPFGTVAIVLMFGVLTLIPAYPTKAGVIQRWRGFLLLGMYLIYVFMTFKPESL